MEKLRDVDFSEAMLVGANLTGVDLTGANLKGANLDGAKLAMSTLPDGTKYISSVNMKRFTQI